MLPSVVLLTQTAWGRVTLVENGAAHADVVVSPQATLDEKSAAQELVRYIEKCTGVDLPLRSERGERPRAIVIGASLASDSVRARLASVGRDGFVIEVSGDTVTLAGNGRQGTQFAAYEFLERVAGIRWLWPGEVGEVVPKHRSLTAEDVSVTKAPAFVWRWLGPGGSLWGPHDKWTKERDLGISTGHQAAQKLWERRNRFGGENIQGGHAWGDIVSPMAWGPKHPEYFALVNGKRDWENFNGKHRCQLCTTNPEVVALATEYCRTHFDANPELDGISIGGNDGRNFCECDNCTRLDTGKCAVEGDDPGELRTARNRVLTDRMMNFVNQVAEGVQRTHPGKKVLFFGYGQFHLPPERTSVTENAVIAYTLNTAGLWHLPAREKAFAELAGWRRMTPTLGIYGYHTQTNFPDMVRLIPDLIQLELRELQRLGVRYYHTQAGNGFAVNGLNFYMLGRLLWDPSADVKAIQADYVQKAFGPAEPAMQRYYDRFIASWREQKSPPVRMLGFDNYDEVQRAYPRELLAAGRGDLDAALRLATTPEHRRRVEFVSDGFRFVEKTMAATEATYPFVKAGWKPGGKAPAGTDPEQLEHAIALWRERDAYVEEHREDFVLSYMWVRANQENGFNPLKRLRATEVPESRKRG